MPRPVTFPSGKTVDIEGLVPLKISTLRRLMNQDRSLLEIAHGKEYALDARIQFVLTALNANGGNLTIEDLDGMTEKRLNKLISVLITDNTPEPNF